MISAIIFDLDGTLVNTEDLIETSLKQAVFALTGREADEGAFRLARLRMGSAPEDRVFDIFNETMGITASTTDVIEAYMRYQRLAYPTVAFTPGAERLIRHFHAIGLPMAIASNTPREKYHLKTRHLRATMDLIPHVVTLDEVRMGKPHPEIMQRAALHLATPPDQCLVFDDSPKGIVAAQAAGMKSVALTFRLTSEQMPGADAYLPDLSHFNPEDWGLLGFPYQA